MILTLQITDEALDSLKENLRISSLDYAEIFSGDSSSLNHYAERILRARIALGLSNDRNEATFN
jgi:hypothetical protein